MDWIIQCRSISEVKASGFQNSKLVHWRKQVDWRFTASGLEDSKQVNFGVQGKSISEFKACALENSKQIDWRIQGKWI